MKEEKSEEVVVMTGATSGIGAYAVRDIVDKSNTDVIVGVRDGRAGPKGTKALPLDLAVLASVCRFAELVRETLRGRKIGVLVLNAGVQGKERTTVDGFEETFAVNHLAHYLLARALLLDMADGGRIVFTTSDMHDPDVLFGGAPRELDTVGWAYGGHARQGTRSPTRAYAASKLCNVLTARSIQKEQAVIDRQVQVVAYNPGLTTGTSLGGRQPAFVEATLRAILRLVSIFQSALYPGTAERSGEALAQLALGEVVAPEGHIYASLVRGELIFPTPSALARDDEARDALWRDSAGMVGLPV